MSLDEHALDVEIGGGVARIRLNRPHRHNAFDDAMVAELDVLLGRMGESPSVRVVVLSGAGKSFCAGADLDWMRRTASASRRENEADAMALAHMLHRLWTLPKPTVALVHGAALGGGAGLVAACDIALATEDAVFAFTEVRLGLIPAVISPYVVAAIGRRAARRYFLTAEQFDAREAERLGLVHAVVPTPGLETASLHLLSHLLEAGPQAVAAAKSLVSDTADRPINESLVKDTARRIAKIRATPEAEEGMGAFLARRRPRWYEG